MSRTSGRISRETVSALQQALAAEHAAVWVYGLVTAFLPEAYSHALRRDRTAHRALRDHAARIITDAGAAPKPAAASYRTPKPVSDERSAGRAVAAAESDAADAWEAVLRHSDQGSGQVRKPALDALSGAAVRGTAWRDAAGMKPTVVALPGMRQR